MIWLENGGLILRTMEWEPFCALVCEQFERNEFQTLLRQLFHLRPTDSVSDYTDKFNELMHSLLAHSSSWDPALFPSRYVDGLKDEIRVVVIVHNPRDLDTAISLAYLQEEALEISKRREPRHTDSGASGRSHLRGAMPLPPPPGRPPPPMPTGEERRVAPNDMARSSASIDERLTMLRAYRRVRHLCYLCGEKWSREHKCATDVQLHVVQELFDVLGISGFDAASEASDTASECHTISKAALDGTVAPQTVHLHGSIQGQKVLMLIDSGSSHSFISGTLAARLEGVVAAKHPLRVQIADGGQLCCAQEVSNCDRWVQGHKFCSTLKVLPLGCYDMIVGMDWLEKHSPMDVHWGRKQLQFLHHGRKVQLQGFNPISSSAISYHLLNFMPCWTAMMCIRLFSFVQSKFQQKRMVFRSQYLFCCNSLPISLNHQQAYLLTEHLLTPSR